MSDETAPDTTAAAAAVDRKALIRPVEELARRQLPGDEEVPTLTEIVEDAPAGPLRVSPEALEALAAKVESLVLEKIEPEIARVEASARAALEAEHAALKREVSEAIRRAVREALAPLQK